MNDKDRKEIEKIVVSTVKNLLVNNSTFQIQTKDIGERLKYYYAKGSKDTLITNILCDLKYDTYINIIPLYYKECKTVEEIAEIFDVDNSTIVRNKKRLLTKIGMRIAPHIIY